MAPTPFNKPPHLLVNIPLDHTGVLAPRALPYTYAAVKARIDKDRPHIEAFLLKVGAFFESDGMLAVKDEKENEREPFWKNGFFGGSDARVAYSVVPAFRPKTIIEIGSGNSTKFFRKAITDYAAGTKLISIDPMPRAEINDLCDVVVRKSVMDAEMELFSALEPGDVLFHDGSHLTLPGTDTVHLFLEILPLIKPGVLIHIHDICLPMEYIEIFRSRGYSEQYMLAAMLLYSDRYRVLGPVTYARHANLLVHGGTSFWLQGIA